VTPFNIEERYGHTLTPGVYAIQVRGPEENDYMGNPFVHEQFFSLTNLAITLKFTGNHALVWVIDTQSGAPAADAAISFYSYTSTKPILTGTTDAEGEAVVEIANNLPGDSKGNINLIARLDENETYGYLEATVSQKWGIPVSDKIEKEQRALWSSHPPIWMLVTFIILMSVVWGHYLVIVIQLFRLRKEEPHLSIKATTS
jgi:hypothetical protein